MPTQTVLLRKDWKMDENIIPAGSRIVVKESVAAELKAAGLVKRSKKRVIRTRRKSNAIS